MPRRVLREAQHREARKQARAPLGALHLLQVSARTQARYRAAASKFQAHHLANNWPLASNWEELDAQLCSFLQFLWEDGEPKGYAADVLSGVQFFLQTRRPFPGSWRLLTTWQKTEIACQAPPLPRQILFAIAGVAMHIKMPRMAAILLLGYHCLLRTGELLDVEKEDILLDASGTGVLCLKATKTSQRTGAREMVRIDDCLVGLFLARAMAGMPAQSRLMPCSADTFKFFFSEVVTLLDAPAALRPYSIRRGGATWDFLAHGCVQRTMLRGRWQSLRAARLYVQDGAAALTEVQLSPTCAARCAQLQLQL